MRKIDLSKQALEFLRRLPGKPARQIAEKLELLTEDAERLPSEQLKGYSPMRRLRAGEFRIVFRLDSDVVKIVLIGKRNDDEIYKLLERTRKK
jgi:mRNA interferase RelE/StbE